MMFLVLAKTPLGSVDYLLNHTNEKYLKKQVLELLQLICSAGYSNVYKKIPQGKAIQNWIKANHTNEMFTWFYLDYAFHLLYLPSNMGFDPKYEIPENYKQIYADFTNVVVKELTDPTDIKTAIFRYQKQYKENTLYESNIELPIVICIN
ncbi:MAG: hypothetical protein IJH34_16600 [Romboutsia sp.]|nr:hypothetical protein [Romboutsia sp.]